jgi:hypothetical protein
MDYHNLNEDRIATKPFPLYQFRDNDVVIREIANNERVKLIILENSSDEWTLVKSPDKFLGWTKMETIIECTREPSLDMQEPVSKAEVDLDGDGLTEKIEVLPDHWCYGGKLYINEQYKSNIDGDYFLIVDLDRDDNYKEIFSCIDPTRESLLYKAGALFSYRNGAVKSMYFYPICTSNITGKGIVYHDKYLPIGKGMEKLILDQTSGILMSVEEEIWQIDLKTKAEENFDLFVDIDSDKKITEIQGGEPIHLVSCKYIYKSNKNYQDGNYYWYLVETEDGMQGWIEARLIKDKLENNWDDSSRNENEYVKNALIDLNGDGIDDEIHIDLVSEVLRYFDTELNDSVEYINETGEFTLRINDSYVNNNVNDNCDGFKIIDVLPYDDYKEIIVYSYGSCGDGDNTIYRYNGNEICEIGELWGDIEIRDGYIYNDDYQSIVYKYVINPKTGLLEEVKQDLYYMGIWALVMDELILYDNREMNKICAVLNKDQLVGIIGIEKDESVEEYDWHGWIGYPRKNYRFLVQTETGSLGWVKISELEKKDGLPPGW